MAKLLLGIWRDSLHVTGGLTACTPGSAPGPTLGNEYGKTLPLPLPPALPLVRCIILNERRHRPTEVTDRELVFVLWQGCVGNHAFVDVECDGQRRENVHRAEILSDCFRPVLACRAQHTSTHGRPHIGVNGAS